MKKRVLATTALIAAACAVYWQSASVSSDGVMEAEARRDPGAERAALNETSVASASEPSDAREPGDPSRTPEDEAQDEFTRVELIRTEGRYPLVRVEETWQRQEDTGAEVLVAKRMMVADHLMVGLLEGRTLADLEAFTAENGLSVLPAPESARVFLVHFDAADPSAMERAKARLIESGIVDEPEPDYLIQLGKPSVTILDSDAI